MFISREALGWLRRRFGFVLALLLVLSVTGSAFATGTYAPCTALVSTDLVVGSAATGDVIATDAINCIVAAVNPSAMLTAIVLAFLPLIVAIWGLRGGTALVSKVVKSAFGALVRRG